MSRSPVRRSGLFGFYPKPASVLFVLLFVIFALAFILVLSYALISRDSATLTIKDANGMSVRHLGLQDGRFVHRFTHSVHMTPVDEEFIISNGFLVLQRLRYDSYGVGMPTDGGESFRIEDNRFVIDMERSFERIDIRVSHLPGHGIEIGGIFYSFLEFAPSESLITLEAGHTFMSFFRRMFAHERDNSKR